MDLTSTRMWQESVAIARELLNITDSDDGSSSGTDDSGGMRGKPAEKKVHACAVCDKTFTRAWVLKNHMRLHNEDKPYKCPEPNCNYVFADRSNLRAHQRVRGHNNWVHKCKNCGKSFKEEAYLKRHLPTACRKYAVYMQRKSMQPKKRAPRKRGSVEKKEVDPRAEEAADMKLETEKNGLTAEEMPLEDKDIYERNTTPNEFEAENTQCFNEEMHPDDKECTDSSPILFDTPSNENEVENIDLIAEYIADTEPIQGSLTEAMDGKQIDKQEAPSNKHEAANSEEVIVISSDSDEELTYVKRANRGVIQTEDEQKRKEEFLAFLDFMRERKNGESAASNSEVKPPQRWTRSRMRNLMQPFQNEREDSDKKVAPKRKLNEDLPKKPVRSSKRIRQQSPK